MKNRCVKVTNVKKEFDEIDAKRIQAVLDGKLDIEWVSSEELLVVQDKIYDRVAGESQTHYGVMTIQ